MELGSPSWPPTRPLPTTQVTGLRQCEMHSHTTCKCNWNKVTQIINSEAPHAFGTLLAVVSQHACRQLSLTGKQRAAGFPRVALEHAGAPASDRCAGPCTHVTTHCRLSMFQGLRGIPSFPSCPGSTGTYFGHAGPLSCLSLMGQHSGHRS